MTTTRIQLDGTAPEIVRAVEEANDLVQRALPLQSGPPDQIAAHPAPGGSTAYDVGRIVANDGTRTELLRTAFLDMVRPQHAHFDLAQLLMLHQLQFRASELGLGLHDHDDEPILGQLAAVFGPNFTSHDVRAGLQLPPTTEPPVPGLVLSRAQAVANALRTELNVPLPNNLTTVLAWAGVQSVLPQPTALARALGRVFDDAHARRFPEAAASVPPDEVLRARQGLGGILQERAAVPRLVERDAAPRPDALARVQELYAHPDGVAPPGSGIQATTNQKKDELFEILAALSNVVNNDMRAYLEAGGHLDLDSIHGVWPLLESRSSLRHEPWPRAVSRAADLIRALPSTQHKMVTDAARSDLGVVLGDIAIGYQATLAEEAAMVRAIEEVVVRDDPMATADDIIQAIKASRSLITQQAGQNAIGLNAARDALSLAPEDEGTYEPPRPGTVHIGNLTYDRKKRKVKLRKPLGQFAVPKSSPTYPFIISTLGGDVEPTLGDIVVDPMEATNTRGCPGLTPVDRDVPAPLADQWDRLAERQRERLGELRPHQRFTHVPAEVQEALSALSSASTLHLHGITGMDVEVVRDDGAPWIAGDDAALEGIELRVDGGKVHITGRPGPVGPNEDGTRPRLTIRLASGTVFFRSEGVEQLVATGVGEYGIEVPDDGRALVEGAVGRLRVGERSTSVVVNGTHTTPWWDLSTATPPTPSKDDAPLVVFVDPSGAEVDPPSASRGYVPVVPVVKRPVNLLSTDWVDAAEDLPAAARDLLESAPPALRRRVDLPNRLDAARNGLQNQVHEALEVADYGPEPARPVCLATSALARRAMVDVRFLDGLAEAADDARLTPFTRGVLREVVDLAGSTSPELVRRRAAVADPRSARNVGWTSDVRTGPLQEALRDHAVQGRVATDVPEIERLRSEVRSLRAALKEHRPTDGVGRFFTDLATVTALPIPALVAEVLSDLDDAPHLQAELVAAVRGSAIQPLVQEQLRTNGCALDLASGPASQPPSARRPLPFATARRRDAALRPSSEPRPRSSEPMDPPASGTTARANKLGGSRSIRPSSGPTFS